MDFGQTFSSLEGKILVASPHMSDPNFEQSLVYICMHDDNGAVGIIINQKIGKISGGDLNKYIGYFHNLIADTKVKKKSASKPLRSSVISKNYPVLFGGPVYSDKMVILSLTKLQEKSFTENQNITMYTDMVSFLREYIKGKEHGKLLFAKGVTAWSPTQLEQEIQDNDWFIIPASVDLLFSQRAKFKWGNVIKDLGINNYSNLVSFSGRA